MPAALFDVFGTLLAFSEPRRPWATLIAPLGLDAAERLRVRRALMTEDFPDLDGVVDALRARYPERRQPGIETIARARSELAAHLASCRLIPGALDALDAVRASGWRVALVSNLSSAYAAPVVANGLVEHADAVIFSFEVGLVKPDPRIFALALGRVGVGAEEAVMIGDSRRADVEGARAAGLEAIWVHARRGDVAALGEVPGVLGVGGSSRRR